MIGLLLLCCLCGLCYLPLYVDVLFVWCLVVVFCVGVLSFVVCVCCSGVLMFGCLLFDLVVVVLLFACLLVVFFLYYCKGWFGCLVVVVLCVCRCCLCCVVALLVLFFFLLQFGCMWCVTFCVCVVLLCYCVVVLCLCCAFVISLDVLLLFDWCCSFVGYVEKKVCAYQLVCYYSLCLVMRVLLCLVVVALGSRWLCVPLVCCSLGVCCFGWHVIVLFLLCCLCGLCGLPFHVDAFGFFLIFVLRCCCFICIGVLLFVVCLCVFMCCCVCCLLFDLHACWCYLLFGFVGCVVLRFKCCFVVVVLVAGFDFWCVFDIPCLGSILWMLFVGFGSLLLLVVMF